jgi:Prolyl-tRNA synthetase
LHACRSTLEDPTYGIGVERVIACSIEQSHDEYGIVWHKSIAPFQVHLLGLNMKKEVIVEASEKVYKQLTDAGLEVLFDDREDAQAGFKFKDADLLGMPIQVIIGEKKLAENKAEIKIRKSGERLEVPLENLAGTVKELLDKI